MSFLQDCIQSRRRRQQEQRQSTECNLSEDEDGFDVKIEPEEGNFEEGVQEDDKASSCDSVPVADLVKCLQGDGGRLARGGVEKDTVTQFFLSMAETVKSFPLLVQAEVKAEVFRCVSTAEIQYLSAKN
mgnify:FL=1